MAWRSVETKLLLDFWLTPVLHLQVCPTWLPAPLLGGILQGQTVLLHGHQDQVGVFPELLDEQSRHRSLSQALPVLQVEARDTPLAGKSSASPQSQGSRPTMLPVQQPGPCKAYSSILLCGTYDGRRISASGGLGFGYRGSLRLVEGKWRFEWRMAWKTVEKLLQI